jgi:transposase
MSTSAHYPTSLSNEQWSVLQLMLPDSKWQPGGPGRLPLDLRRVLDGMFYVHKTGCQWRMMPHDFGNGRRSMAIFVKGRKRHTFSKLTPFTMRVLLHNSLRDFPMALLPRKTRRRLDKYCSICLD